ncbi:MAG: hypothetical protein ABI742_06235 [Gemmatimonadota bacterium]
MRHLSWAISRAALSLLAAMPLKAQSSAIAALPADRVADLLALQPGVASLEDGDLSIRGAGRDAIAAFLDGVPLTPGRRGGSTALLGGSWFGATGSGAALGTNSFEDLGLLTGVGPAEFTAARGAAIGVTSRDPGTGTNGRVRLGGTWGTDALFGKSNGLNFNRVTLNGDGRFGRFALGLSAMLEGQGSARLGLDQNASPVYLANGVDTTVTVNGPGGVTNVDVLRFIPSPGIRTPVSAVSDYTLLARGSYFVGQRSRLQLMLLGSQHQFRQFDYQNLYNPQQLGAERDWSRAVTGSWLGDLSHRDGFTLGADVHLSWQTDRSTSGPLTQAGEAGSRNPFGGFLLSPLDFRFDAGSFPVDDALIRNFRTNAGRRSPYDLNNTTQYQLIDQFRNNAYGLDGFSEAGGPVGLLRLSEENRLVGKGALDARIGARHHLRVGAEWVGYKLRYFSSQLTSQVFADAYVESPKRQAAFADYDLSLGAISLSAGVRYDRFRTGASRPAFPRISTAPGFDPANPAAGFVADKSHGRVSPTFRAEFKASAGLTMHGGIGWAAQLPDFGQALAGINTDLSTTTTVQVFGTDLGFERRTLGELGARVTVDDRTAVDASVWARSDHGVVKVRLRQEFDPLALQQRDVFRYVNGSDRSGKGLDLRISRSFGAHGQGLFGYSYADASLTGVSNGLLAPQDIPLPDSRPHTLVAALLYESGPAATWLGGFLRNTGLYSSLRVATGSAYTACPVSNPFDNGTLSGESCSGAITGNLNGFRLPMLKVLDLKLTRSFPIGGTTITAFADARNLLNWRNVTRVFAQTGTTANAAERTINRLGDAQSLAAEAAQNGRLQADSTIDLTFGGVQDPRTGCAGWQSSSGVDATPNCVYLIHAEERFGNADHLFTRAEQTRASDALYRVARGLQNFTSPGRRVRIGMEVRF